MLVVGVVFVVNNVTCVALFWRETLVGASSSSPQSRSSQQEEKPSLMNG